MELCGTGPGSYCAAFSSSTDWEHITNVHVGTINHTSGSSGYADYTYLSTEMALETDYPITVTLYSEWSSDVGGAWVDWNQDGDFDDADETITTSWSGVGPYEGTITPPADAEAGPTRLRVRIQDGGYDPTLDSCGTTPNPTCGTTGPECDLCLLVGGGLHDGQNRLTCSYANEVNRNSHYDDNGFRCCADEP